MELHYAVDDGFELKESTRKFVEGVFEHALDYLELSNKKGLLYIVLEENPRKNKEGDKEYEVQGSVFKMQGFYIMRIAVKGRPFISLAETIGHEMTHVQQMVRGDLKYWAPKNSHKGFPEIRIWKNEVVPLKMTHKEYLELEFEKEARQVGFDIALDYILATEKKWFDRLILRGVLLIIACHRRFSSV
jgi:hypothetical protein